MLIFKLLLLLIVANGAPVLANLVCGQRWSAPIDAGLRLRDGQPLLGRSKTWRGLLVALLATTLAAPLLQFSWRFGLCFGLVAMLGDLFSSFCKRRLGLASSAKASGLDQLPEALLPALLGWYWLAYDWLVLIVVVGLFMVLEILGSPLLFALGIRRRPY